MPKFEGAANLLISNAVGQVVSQQLINQSETSIENLEFLPNGLYLLNIELPNGEILKQKLLKN